MSKYTEQQLCDAIRRNMDEKQMTQALESAGFAVFERGQELVEAVANAIMQGDVSAVVCQIEGALSAQPRM